MAEVTLDLRGVPKAQAYEELESHIRNVLADVDDIIAEMATISALVHHAFGWLWTGFYRVVEPGKLLRIGPYQGTLGCLDIPFESGVCGSAAAERRTIIVEDVTKFPGHITCDARSRSEIVVPVFNAKNDLIAVFDIDAETVGAFDHTDQLWLEKILARFRDRS
jgi:L-methionine (R)-S-oxide reductase